MYEVAVSEEKEVQVRPVGSEPSVGWIRVGRTGLEEECRRFLLEEQQNAQRVRQELEQTARRLANGFERGPDSNYVRRVAFIKLIKTAGTTFASSVLFPYCVKHRLSYLFPRAWPTWWVSPKPDPPASPDGHVHMLYRHFPAFPRKRKWLEDTLRRPLVLTILRDPIRRAVSRFNFKVQLTDGYSKDFGQYLREDHEFDHQSKWLGYSGDSNFLAATFDVVGIAERFDESMLLFRRAMDISLSDSLYVSQRVASGGLSVSELDSQTVQHIRDIDSVDVDLYEQAQQRFKSLVEGVPDLDEDLVTYRAALGDFSHGLWKERGPFKIGYVQGDEWAAFDPKTGLKQLRTLQA